MTNDDLDLAEVRLAVLALVKEVYNLADTVRQTAFLGQPHQYDRIDEIKSGLRQIGQSLKE
jgi:hypothetical protein